MIIDIVTLSISIMLCYNKIDTFMFLFQRGLHIDSERSLKVPPWDFMLYMQWMLVYLVCEVWLIEGPERLYPTLGVCFL